MSNAQLRSIPPVNAIATRIQERLGSAIAPELLTAQAQRLQREVRALLGSGGTTDPNAWIMQQIASLEALLLRPRLTGVLNATGIVIHTNLGRASVSPQTAEAMREAASHPVTLEVDPTTGRRGGRMSEIAALLQIVAGADSSLVVNNNAAGMLLVLSALASGKRVAVSRGEAVEIGGGFRIPDVLAQSGATLVEVGTTNRTYASDFAAAVEQGADVLLKVHPSNFSINGFVATPTTKELRDIADRTGAILIEDLGSGTLVATERYGIAHEPMVQESLASGADLVLFSGDKLLGGPQAGLICGRKDLIERIGGHPLARAVRSDKTALAGVAQTLHHYVRGDYESEIPVWRAIAATPASLQARAHLLASRFAGEGVAPVPVETVNHVGGGALPGQSLPGWGVRFLMATSGDATAAARKLRLATPVPVFARIEDDAVVVELRTVMPESDEVLLDAINNATAEGSLGRKE